MQGNLRSIEDHSDISHHQSHFSSDSITNIKAKHHEREKDFKIPLISKKMNSIEKYISQFDDKQYYLKADNKGSTFGPSKYIDNSTERELIDHYRSVDVYNFVGEEARQSLEGQSCVKYSSIANESSEDRLDKLAQLQKDYSLLKQKLRPHKKNVSSELTGRKSQRNFPKKQVHNISQDDIEREIKNTVINDNGKKYYADLYLLKKGRQNIMNSLSNAGKLALGPTSDSIGLSQLLNKQSYEEKVKSNEKDLVSQKIVEDREVKRSKMMKGRNLHWNVYYDMLALSASERQKLKGFCKFSSTFGIN